MTRTCGSKLLCVCAICGMERPDGSEDGPTAWDPIGVSQTTTFDASPLSLDETDFPPATGFSISTFIVTGAGPVWASIAHAQKHPARSPHSPPVRRVVTRVGTRKCTLASD